MTKEQQEIVDDWMFRLNQPVVDCICELVLEGRLEEAVSMAAEDSGGDNDSSTEDAQAFIDALKAYYDEQSEDEDDGDEPVNESADQEPEPEPVKSVEEEPAVKADEVRDYGSTGINKKSGNEMKLATNTIAALIEQLGFYEVMSCLANACVQTGKNKDAQFGPTTGHGTHWYDAARVVDRVVAEVRKGK